MAHGFSLLDFPASITSRHQTYPKIIPNFWGYIVVQYSINNWYMFFFQMSCAFTIFTRKHDFVLIFDTIHHRIGWWDNFNRKAIYLMVKTMVSGVDFPLNQSIECLEESLFNEWRPVDHQITKDQSTYFPFSSCVSLNPSTDRMVISLYHYMSIHMNIYKCMLDLIKKKKTYI